MIKNLDAVLVIASLLQVSVGRGGVRNRGGNVVKGGTLW